ncbi:hypothetical protein MTO96_032648 [Rhipicephalus appendiculatus]
MEDRIVLPDQVRSVLELGPKYAIAPRKTRPELLSIVRQVSRLVPQEDSDHCTAEGVGVLFKTRPSVYDKDFEMCVDMDDESVIPDKAKLLIKETAQYRIVDMLNVEETAPSSVF